MMEMHKSRADQLEEELRMNQSKVSFRNLIILRIPNP